MLEINLSKMPLTGKLPVKELVICTLLHGTTKSVKPNSLHQVKKPQLTSNLTTNNKLATPGEPPLKQMRTSVTVSRTISSTLEKAFKNKEPSLKTKSKTNGFRMLKNFKILMNKSGTRLLTSQEETQLNQLINSINT